MQFFYNPCSFPHPLQSCSVHPLKCTTSRWCARGRCPPTLGASFGWYYEGNGELVESVPPLPVGCRPMVGLFYPIEAYVLKTGEGRSLTLSLQSKSQALCQVCLSYLPYNFIEFGGGRQERSHKCISPFALRHIDSGLLKSQWHLILFPTKEAVSELAECLGSCSLCSASS